MPEWDGVIGPKSMNISEFFGGTSSYFITYFEGVHFTDNLLGDWIYQEAGLSYKCKTLSTWVHNCYVVNLEII